MTKPGWFLLASALTALAPSAQAQSLVELYESARAFDATYQSARLQYDANLAHALLIGRHIGRPVQRLRGLQRCVMCVEAAVYLRIGVFKRGA